MEREELARGHIGPGEEPVEPRPAATLVLARPPERQDQPFRVLLLRRPRASRFAAGAYVFPGGTLDAGDAAPELAPRLPRAVPPPERPAAAAALRELFEETGLLPADRPPPPEEGDRVQELREALLADRVSFGEVCRALDLSFRDLPLAYAARWITPARLTRRYDTRFFLAAHRGGEPELTDEHTAHVWEAPGEALERFHAGERPMLFPTWKTLEALARHPDLEAALRTLAERAVEPIRARLLVEGDRVTPVMPGDPGYEDAR